MWNFPLIDPSGKFFKGRLQRKKMEFSTHPPLGEKKKKKKEQAGAELGQAQLQLGLGFTSTIDS